MKHFLCAVALVVCCTAMLPSSAINCPAKMMESCVTYGNVTTCRCIL